MVSSGVDIVEIQRIKDSIENIGEKFKKKVYTDKEIKYCESKKINKYQHYAARFAAKEAIFKAISRFLENKYDFSWKNVEILNDEQGKPIINFIGVEFKKISSIDISISHCREFAIANVVLQYREQ